VIFENKFKYLMSCMLIVLIILQIGLGKMFYKHYVEIIFVWLAAHF